MAFDGKIPEESINDVIHKSFQFFKMNRDDLFSNPDYVEKDNSGEQNVRLFYNHSTMKMEPFNFSEYQKYFEDIENDMDNMEG